MVKKEFALLINHQSFVIAIFHSDESWVQNHVNIQRIAVQNNTSLTYLCRDDYHKINWQKQFETILSPSTLLFCSVRFASQHCFLTEFFLISLSTNIIFDYEICKIKTVHIMKLMVINLCLLLQQRCTSHYYKTYNWYFQMKIEGIMEWYPIRTLH